RQGTVERGARRVEAGRLPRHRLGLAAPESRRPPPSGEIDRTRRTRMRNPARRALGIAAAGVAIIALVAPTMAAAPAGDRGTTSQARRIDNHPGPLTERQN